MKFISTRDTSASPAGVSSAEAIKQGLAPDKGLYMPVSIPALTREDLEKLSGMPYEQRAADILSRFLTDYDKDALLADCTAAYAEDRFPGGAAPLVDIGGGIHSLELWHGPTCDLKDMALQIMPRLLSRALTMTGEQRLAHILVATSGDTGKAALEGYRDVPGVKITVFYPVDGVSAMQKRQMTTQLGENVNVCAVYGNFDDAQNGVKAIFADNALAEKANDAGFFFSSANSINWGRLAPQIVYYVSAYCDLVKSGTVQMGDEVNVCVPTGNFGNIFAAYIAREMGLPLGRLICASNANCVLTDFIRTGHYDRNRKFYNTMSPSMDILISSNLERLLFALTKDADEVKG
ncbi:MAG: threonine synthase, partial [Clostridia bacterium]|nr:threonine synthase [Clostridia bacterium]